MGFTKYLIFAITFAYSVPGITEKQSDYSTRPSHRGHQTNGTIESIAVGLSQFTFQLQRDPAPQARTGTLDKVAQFVEDFFRPISRRDDSEYFPTEIHRMGRTFNAVFDHKRYDFELYGMQLLPRFGRNDRESGIRCKADECSGYTKDGHYFRVFTSPTNENILLVFVQAELDTATFLTWTENTKFKTAVQPIKGNMVLDQNLPHVDFWMEVNLTDLNGSDSRQSVESTIVDRSSGTYVEEIRDESQFNLSRWESAPMPPFSIDISRDINQLNDEFKRGGVLGITTRAALYFASQMVKKGVASSLLH
ncbi:MAG: hypothetical protein KDD25_05715 [Bdellovibrionales bacterium]|nr:hypothetical protein [Bdellovibrionales bacterium]